MNTFEIYVCILGYSGIVNLGNTCYQNAILQGLFATQRFRQILLSSSVDDEPSSALDQKQKHSESKEDEREREKQKKLCENLQQLFAHMQMSQRPAANQAKLKRYSLYKGY